MPTPIQCPHCSKKTEVPLQNATSQLQCSSCKKSIKLAQLETKASPHTPPGRHSIEDLPEKIGNEFEMIRPIGEGGMGVVYLARQLSVDRLVAIKILPSELAQEQDFVQRFQREVEALTALRHPHIVQIIAKGRKGGLIFYVMEYIHGMNLRELMDRGNLSLSARLRIIRKTCRGLSFAHKKGIIHRDIKPENILISREGYVKISDFGLARMMDHASIQTPELTATAMVMGTLKYMAPEQRQDSKSVDHRADIYSLGVVFYELITGREPVGRFALPSEIDPSLPPEIDSIIDRALQSDPEDRYQKVGEIRQEIISFQKGQKEKGERKEEVLTESGDELKSQVMEKVSSDRIHPRRSQRSPYGQSNKINPLYLPLILLSFLGSLALLFFLFFFYQPPRQHPFQKGGKKPEEKDPEGSSKKDSFSKEEVLDHSRAHKHYREGMKHLKDTRFLRALTSFNKALASPHEKLKDSRKAQYYYARGRTHMRLDNPKSAIGDFTRTLKLNPRHQGALFHRARLYGKKGNYSQSIADLDKILSQPDSPFHYRAYYLLGLNYFNQEKYQEASNILKRLLSERKEGEADSSQIKWNLVTLALAEIYMIQREFKKAQKHFQKVRQRDISNYRACLGLGLIHLGQEGEENLTKARQFFDQALAHKKKSHKSHFCMAMVEVHGKKYLSAMDHLDKTITYHSRLGKAYYWRALLGSHLYKSGERRTRKQYLQYIKDYQRARRLGINLRKYSKYRGQSAPRSLFFEEALEVYLNR